MPRSTRANFALRIAAVVAFLLVMWAIDQAAPAQRLPRVATERHGFVAMQAAALVCGIVFGWLHARFKSLSEAGREDISIGDELRGMLRSTNFYMALTAAPVVFAGTVLGGSHADTVSSLMGTFASGFFWQRVLPGEPRKPQ